MIFKSKLNTFVSQCSSSLQDKSLFLRKNFPTMVALLLFGFLVGNIFGTFLNTLRFFFIWDGFIIFILIGLLEIVNYTVYRVIHYGDYSAKNRVLSQKIMVRFINFFKIGLMIGFFVDAFKVGS
jgi:hypothetical protein